MRWLSSSLRPSSVSDPKRPHAKAALAKDGTFAFIGDAAAARELVCEGTQVLDYGDNFIYPGFLESHCHGYFAGDRAIWLEDLSRVVPTDYDKYREIIGDFIRQNPEREVYMATGWTETDQ